MFADDTKIWKRIIGLKDCVELQEDLIRLQSWSEEWLLQFNPEKCKVMHVGHDYKFSYVMKQENKTYSLKSIQKKKKISGSQ